MNSDIVVTGAIGAGYWGKHVVRNLHLAPGAHLKYICDANADVHTSLHRAYPEAHIVQDIEVVLADPEVQAVAVAVPSSRHYPVVKRALQAGKHVFVEKPMTLELAHADELVALSDQVGRHVMVGHLMEYHPAVEYLRQIIEKGELGDLYYAYSTRVNLGKVRTDENALWSLAVHDVSMIRYIFGQEPVEVSAHGASFVQQGIEDVSFVTLSFADGKMAHIHVSWLDPHKERRLTLVGTERMAVFDDVHLNEKVRIYDKGVESNGNGTANYAESISVRNGDIFIPWLSTQEPLARECQHFIECVRHGRRPRSDARVGRSVVRILAAAQHSMESGGARVRLEPQSV